MSDSDSEDIEAKDWTFNNPSEQDLRFISDSDVIISDDSENKKSDSSKLISYNQLLPRGKLINKLLRSTNPNLNTTWRTVDSTLNFSRTHSADNIAHNQQSKFLSSDDSDSDQGHSSIYKKINPSKSRSKAADKSLNSASFRGNKNKKRTIESSVTVEDKDSESELEIALKSSESMAKSHKRKHEASDSDEVETSRLKKIKINEDKSVSKTVKRNESWHNVSGSESEDSEGNSTELLSKRLESENKLSRNPLNTHLLSSESEAEADLSYNIPPSIEVSDNVSKSAENSEEETNLVRTTAVVTANTSENRKKHHRIPKITPELNEEISKYSMLLDENLIENNDVWILQCPSNMDCSALVNQRLSLGGSCQLRNGETTYESFSYRNSQPKSAMLAVPSERNRLNLCRIPITGSIIVEESIKPVNNISLNKIISELPSRVEFPENLRTRHPLLGIDFSKQPRTAERITESLPKKKKQSKKHGESFNGSALVSPSSPTSAKKKKKSKDRGHEDVTTPDHAGQLFKESVESSSVKKKKKKKHKDNDNFS